MSLHAVLDALFGPDASVTLQDEVFAGEATFGGRRLRLLGTAGGAPLSAHNAHLLAGHVLDAMRDTARPPIVMMLDNTSQKLALPEELIGNCRVFAHLAQCLDLAGRLGHATLTLVYRQAVSGGFLAAGMSAPRCFALPGAELRVMDIGAMARITRLPVERLEELRAQSPVFAPGVQNFWSLGIIEEIWDGDLRARLAAALDAEPTRTWRDLGQERGGRTLAGPVSKAVLDAS
jgi:malonate decarboxylase gamma subunit